MAFKAFDQSRRQNLVCGGPPADSSQTRPPARTTAPERSRCTAARATRRATPNSCDAAAPVCIGWLRGGRGRVDHLFRNDFGIFIGDDVFILGDRRFAVRTRRENSPTTASDEAQPEPRNSRTGRRRQRGSEAFPLRSPNLIGDDRIAQLRIAATVNSLDSRPASDWRKRGSPRRAQHASVDDWSVPIAQAGQDGLLSRRDRPTTTSPNGCRGIAR